MKVAIHRARSEIAAAQLEQLRSLLAELFPANKFYARKLSAAGITFDVASLEDFSQRFPFTTKAELVQDQRSSPPFGTNLSYPLGRYTRYHQTSGTTGRPLRWLDTPESWEGMVESWMEILQAAGAEAEDRIYFAFSFGPFIGFWLAFEAAGRLGCLCVPGGGLSSVARVRAMLENGITILCCTPTYAMRLAEAAVETKIDLSTGRVRRIIVAGEAGGSIPSVRARLEQLWPGARVFDHHGMTEVGPVTYECPARPGLLHVIESAYYAEVIEPGGNEPVAAGQSGELVLTTLGRVGSPLLRYRTGDLVKVGGPRIEVRGQQSEVRGQKTEERGQKSEVRGQCVCGRYEMALEGGILGRTDEMVVVRGVNVYPSAVEEIVRGCVEVAEYRAEISRERTLAELRLQIELSPGCADGPEVVRKLERSFEAALSLRVPITLVPFGSLPRFEMKGKRWAVTH